MRLLLCPRGRISEERRRSEFLNARRSDANRAQENLEDGRVDLKLRS